jgi:hypothetical protein
MSILEGKELNWIQFQISHGIGMICNSIFIVLDVAELEFGILRSNSTQFRGATLCIERESF